MTIDTRDSAVHGEGSAFRLDDEGIQADPFAYYEQLRDETPVLQTDLGGNEIYVISRSEDITRVLMDPATFSSRNNPAPTVLHADPPDHKPMRAMISGLFSRSAVRTMEPFITQRADELLDDLIGSEPNGTASFEIVSQLAGPLTISVISRLLGISVDDVKELRARSKLAAEYVRAIRMGAAPSPESANALNGLIDFATQLVETGAYNADGVVAYLAQLTEAGEMTPEQRSHTIQLLLVAGHTTTTNLIANSVFTLARSPENLARLRDEPEFVDQFIEEVLRTRGSFQRLPRLVTRDVEIAGTLIPAGATVYVLLGSGNRDPGTHPDPDEFAPGRQEMHLSFGHGIHTCLGQWLARLEARTALRALADRVERVRLDPERPPHHLTGGTFNEFGFEALPVTVDLLADRVIRDDADLQIADEQAVHRTISHDGGRTAELEIDVQVAAKTVESEGVVSLRLVRPDGQPMPAWTPGSHLDLILGTVATRQYSLCGDPADDQSWRIGVLRDESGRGSSRHVHDTLAAGDTVRIRGPRNNFELVDAPRYIFIAGGIGITPILPMIARAEAAGADWKLIYGGRQRASMAFLGELEKYGDRVQLCPADEVGMLDLAGILGTPEPDALVYCCGPEALLGAVEQNCADWPLGALHLERFSPRRTDEQAPTRPFELTLERAGITLTVPEDKTVLETVEEAGIHVMSSCREGTCGTCEVGVLAGTPDHRDSVLGELERTTGRCMMICVSRSITPGLTLDL